jgi:hypothetical protein
MAPDYPSSQDPADGRVVHSEDAELDQDGKAFRPKGKSAATVIPAAFGLAGVNLQTYNG